MAEMTVAERFNALAESERESADDYNFHHFRGKHLLLDALGTIRSKGIQPGEIAPDFTLPRVGGGEVTLSELRPRPVLLHFGSFT